jgi:hypothetical protein
MKSPLRVTVGMIPWWVYFIATVLFVLALITIIAGIVWILIGVIVYATKTCEYLCDDTARTI